MIVSQDPETGYWTKLGALTLQTHEPDQCLGEYCDIHDKRHPNDAHYPLNWREDRGVMEFICDHGIGHPTYAQYDFLNRTLGVKAWAYTSHGCDGCCAV